MKNMQINVHYAIGVIIAGITHIFLPLSGWMFALIIFGSMFPDLDIVFSKFAPQNNHRNLVTHSIYLPVIWLIIGIIAQSWVIFIAGAAYLLHILSDMLDWGVDLFLSGKTYGPRLLIKSEERGEKYDVLDKTQITPLFFTKRYYSATFIKIIELSSFVLMILFIFAVEIDHWYFMFGYFAAGGFHLLKYIIAKRKSNA